MIENETISQGTIDGYKSALEEANTETVHRGLRASNTVHTLRPTEVTALKQVLQNPHVHGELANRGLEIDYKAVHEFVQGPEYPGGDILCVPGDVIDSNLPSPESESDVQGVGLFIDPTVVGPETDSPEEDRTWVLALILDRLEELEETFEALIARIEKHDIRASHRILRD